MKLSKVLGAVLVAALALVALGAASASAALPTILPTTAAFSSESGATEFGTGITALKSPKSKGSGKGTGEKTSSFSTVFEGTKDQLGRSCKGLGDATAGNVTVTGTADVRYANSKKEAVAIGFLINETHIECGTTLILVKGCVAGEAEKPYNKAITATAVKLEVEKGDNKLVKIENAANTAEEACELKASINEEAAALSSESATENLKAFTGGKGAGNEVEVMA
jgi:hypothetical protein